MTAPWCTKGGSAPSLSLVQQASRLSVDSQRAPRGTRASLSKGWKKFFADSWGGLCQGVCACPLSAVERSGGGRQGAEFDHRDGDPSNGHITNFQLLCLTCHEAKTAIQRACRWTSPSTATAGRGCSPPQTTRGPSIMIWKHPIPHIRPMQDGDAERRGAPESGPGVRLTGVLWSSWGDGWGVLW